MLARYKDVVSTVLAYTRSNEKLIRRAVIQMLPRLAAFAPERFAMKYLQPCTAYLLSVLRNPAERGAGARFNKCTSQRRSIASRHRVSLVTPLCMVLPGSRKSRAQSLCGHAWVKNLHYNSQMACPLLFTSVTLLN